MAFSHISFDASTVGGRMLRRMLQQNEDGDDLMRDVREAMIAMRDGADNAGDHSNYAEVTRQFGFGGYVVGNPSSPNTPTSAQNTKAREAFLELDAAYAKTSGDGSVSGVRAARNQLYDKLRG